MLPLTFFIIPVVEDEVQVVNAQAGGKPFVTQHVGDELVFLMLENADFSSTESFVRRR